MGPLQGLRIIELAGLGPAPFCAMMLADMGATVIRVDRVSAQPGDAAPVDTLLRNRRSIALNLKSPAGIAALLRLIEALEEQDDVQAVYSNYDIPDEVLDAISAA
mgnify:CR=1 FL=1